MTTEANTNPGSPGGTPTSADGVDGAGGEGSGKGTVSHDTYMKVLGEAKSAKAQLAQREQADREAANKKALDEKNYLSIIDDQKAEVERLKQENQSHQKDKQDFRKLNSAMGLLQEKGIQLESQYLPMIPIENIIVDENGNPDKTSVAKVVADFQKQHPRLVLPANKILPSDRSGNPASKLSREDFQKLPRTEQVKALKEGRVNTDPV